MPSDFLRTKQVTLWVEWRGEGERAAADAAYAQAIVARAQATGATALGLETRSRDGGDVVTRWQPLVRAARAANLKVVAIHPAFIADSDTPPERLAWSARWAGEGWAVEPPSPGEARALSPALEENRAEELSRLNALMRNGDWDALVLVNLGFPGLLADVSPAARAEWQSWSAFNARRWPEEVLGDQPSGMAWGPEQRGPYWQSWTLWRAMVLRDFMVRLQESRLADPRRRPVLVLVDAPYAAHQRQGLNWVATNSRALQDHPWLGAGYTSTAAGHLVDGVVLGFWENGVLTAGDAERHGLAWWGSVEGATTAARSYLPTATATWGAVIAEGSDWRETAERAREMNGGVLLISAGRLASGRAAAD